MKIAFGVDPGGLELRESILAHLEEAGHEVVEVGTLDQDNVIPYMYVAKNVAEQITGGDCEFGIVVCGTGVGISIAANKNKGIRCALVDNIWVARDCRVVNNANVIALGGTTTSARMANEYIDAFLFTEWGEGLPQFRVDRIKSGAKNLEAYEDEQFGK